MVVILSVLCVHVWVIHDCLHSTAFHHIFLRQGLSWNLILINSAILTSHVAPVFTFPGIGVMEAHFLV